MNMFFVKLLEKQEKNHYMVLQEKKSEEYLGGVLSIAQNLSALTKKVNLLSVIGSKNNYKTKIKKNLIKIFFKLC